jgi:hypothetical protein
VHYCHQRPQKLSYPTLPAPKTLQLLPNHARRCIHSLTLTKPHILASIRLRIRIFATPQNRCPFHCYQTHPEKSKTQLNNERTRRITDVANPSPIHITPTVNYGLRHVLANGILQETTHLCPDSERVGNRGS